MMNLLQSMNTTGNKYIDSRQRSQMFVQSSGFMGMNGILCKSTGLAVHVDDTTSPTEGFDTPHIDDSS